jgi:hypothetical protein
MRQPVRCDPHPRCSSGLPFAGSNAGPCTVWRISTSLRRVFRKRKKSGLFAEVRRFHGVTEVGAGKVVKKKGLDAQSCKQRAYGNKRTEHVRMENEKTIEARWSFETMHGFFVEV